MGKSHCLLFNPKMPAVRLLEAKLLVERKIIRNVVWEDLRDSLIVMAWRFDNGNVDNKVIHINVSDRIVGLNKPPHLIRIKPLLKLSCAETFVRT